MDRRTQHRLALALAALTLRLLPVAAAQEAAPAPEARPPAPEADPLAAARRADRRARREEIEQFLDGKGGDAPVNKLLDRLPPGADREAFRRNLLKWRDLSPEERNTLRGQVDNRGAVIKAEIDKTINESGLQLNADQREVYSLRYMQERRKLERSLRDQMGAERARRLPGILAQLKKELTPPSNPPATPVPKPSLAPVTPTPKPAPPAASPTPAVS